MGSGSTCQTLPLHHEDAGVGLEVDPGGRLDCLCAIVITMVDLKLFSKAYLPPGHGR